MIRGVLILVSLCAVFAASAKDINATAKITFNSYRVEAIVGKARLNLKSTNCNEIRMEPFFPNLPEFKIPRQFPKEMTTAFKSFSVDEEVNLEISYPEKKGRCHYEIERVVIYLDKSPYRFSQYHLLPGSFFSPDGVEIADSFISGNSFSIDPSAPVWTVLFR